MATTFPAVLIAQTSIPRQIEAKFTFLPKVSTVLVKVASMLPKGPNLPLPSMITTAPTLPKLPSIFKGPSVISTTTAGLDLAPRVPGAQRGGVDYGKLSDSPLTPGVGRGSITYGS